MLLVRATVAAALVAAVAASPVWSQPGPGITLIEVEYCAYLNNPVCTTAIATFELSFPEGSGVSLENNSVLTFGLTSSGDLYGAGCTNSALLCAQPAGVKNSDGMICVKAVIDARSLPGGMFGNFLLLNANLEPADPSGEACDFPGPASLRMYTNCIDPLSPGDVFRRGESGLFRIMEVSPADCGFVPIATEQQTWGTIKAMYR
jgi:hypothetical protein